MSEVLLITHTGRAAAVQAARRVASRLAGAGVGVRVLSGEADHLGLAGAAVVQPNTKAADGVDIVLVLGGDGTLLRGAELARPAGAPLLGVNLGRVGFLAETEPELLDSTVDRLTRLDFDVQDRLTVDVSVQVDGSPVAAGWALNEVSVEKTARERMLDVVAEVDGRPLSRWGCDGVVCATPTGSTAYAFSAGGPVVWPEVQALLLVPLSAHALFSRPLVTGPGSVLAIELMSGSGGAVMFCDGRRTMELSARSRIEVRRGAQPVRLARLFDRPFTDRLVAKFELPVAGWRGALVEDCAPE